MKSYSPICVDASFVLHLLESPSDQEKEERLWRQWKTAGRRIVAPSLLFYEVTNALHQYARHGLLSLSEVRQALYTIALLDIEIFENLSIHQQALDLAHELTLKATYDAHYLALAQQLGAGFWTADARLVKAVGDSLPWVHLC